MVAYRRSKRNNMYNRKHGRRGVAGAPHRGGIQTLAGNVGVGACLNVCIAVCTKCRQGRSTTTSNGKERECVALIYYIDIGESLRSGGFLERAQGHTRTIENCRHPPSPCPPLSDFQSLLRQHCRMIVPICLPKCNYIYIHIHNFKYSFENKDQPTKCTET